MSFYFKVFCISRKESTCASSLANAFFGYNISIWSNSLPNCIRVNSLETYMAYPLLDSIKFFILYALYFFFLQQVLSNGVFLELKRANMLHQEVSLCERQYSRAIKLLYMREQHHGERPWGFQLVTDIKDIEFFYLIMKRGEITILPSKVLCTHHSLAEHPQRRERYDEDTPAS